MRSPSVRASMAAIFAVLLLAPLPGAAQQPRGGGVLRIAHVGEPPSLDTHMTGGAIPTHILNNVYEGLFAMDSKFQPRPMLAEKLDLSQDRLTHTITLRKGIRFHNGKEMTS